VPQVGPSTLSGDKPNTFQGAFTLVNGVLDLDKPAGVDAIPGDLIIGTKGSAVVRLQKPDQINDAAHVTLGEPASAADLQGHDEKFASLTLKSHAEIILGEKPAALVIGDSRAQAWDLTTNANLDPGLMAKWVSRLDMQSSTARPRFNPRSFSSWACWRFRVGAIFVRLVRHGAGQPAPRPQQLQLGDEILQRRLHRRVPARRTGAEFPARLVALRGSADVGQSRRRRTNPRGDLSDGHGKQTDNQDWLK